MLILILKALHLIAMVAWFAGLFYLPRLFVYHTTSKDHVSDKRFIIMERRLYWGIMTPAAIATIACGSGMVFINPSFYLMQSWLWRKLFFVGLLIIFHLYCGHLRQCFATHKNTHGEMFYRWINEIPTVLLIVIVFLAVLK